MNSAMLGSVTALTWGTADFAARFSGRALGHENALLGMLFFGSIFLTLYVWLSGVDLVWAWDSIWLVFVSGLSIMMATLLLYQKIARGPITLVTPIVCSYPVLVMVLSVLFGNTLGLTDWLLVGLVLCGVFLVARFVPTGGEPQQQDPRYRRTTILISLGSALAFCAVVFTGQAAAVVYGEIQTTWMGRLTSLVLLLLLFAARHDYRVNLPVRWWPVVGAQGALDSIGYIALFAAGTVPSPELAAVTASAFGAVTALFARAFLGEQIGRLQGLGMVMVFAGVGWLSV